MVIVMKIIRWPAALVILLSIAATHVTAQTASYALFVTRDHNDMFYRHMIGFAQQAANDLNVKLDTYYAGGSHHQMIHQVETALKAYNQPCGFMFVNFKGIDKQIIELAEKYEVPVLVFNAETTPRYALGKPRDQYRYWIGSLLPDDEGAGYQLMNVLADGGQQLSITAFAGEYESGSSAARVLGLERALSERPQWRLNQLVHAFWDQHDAHKKAISLLKRYPATDVFWSASDGMALGAFEACEQLLGSCSVRAGGVDWTEEALEAIGDGKLVASMGGHFMEAAWALVMLYDYTNGHDFVEQGVELTSTMHVISRDNLDSAWLALNPNSWKRINFKSYSRAYNNDIGHYDFSVESVLQRIQQHFSPFDKLNRKSVQP